MATPPPKKTKEPDVPAPAPPTPTARKGEEPKDEVSAVRPGGRQSSGAPMPSVAPTRVELKKGSAPKAPNIPRELRDKMPPPVPPVPPEAAEHLADDGLIEIDTEDLEVVRNPSEPPAASISSRPPTELSAICDFGRYQILGRLAFGGMAEIFLARESSEAGASRHMVIKRILPHVADDDSFVKMFLDEARLAMHLNHPNICHIYEFGQLDGSYFIAMEWVNGVPLGKLIRRARADGGMPAGYGVRVISRIAEALHYAHRAKDQMGRPMGIVHRDVSPHNIMVSYDGNAKLLDFGIAKASTHATKTKAGVVKGKFSYMAPQQCLGQPIDGRADVFALGVCLYETITGRPLYHRKTEYETMRAVIEDPVPSIREARPELPAALDAIVQKSLAKSEADRYQTAGEMQNALETWLAQSGEVVSANQIGEYMEELYEDEIKRGPLVDSVPFGMSLNQYPRQARTPSAAGMGTGSATGEVVGEAGTGRAGWLTAVAMGVLAIAIGAYAALRTEESPETVFITRDAPAPEVTTPPPEPPPPEVAPAPRLGSLAVSSTPPGATVKVGDRQLAGETPLELGELEPGTHHVVVSHRGFADWEGEVEVAPGEQATLTAALERVRRAPAAPAGRLSINTRPWSKVYVGGRLLGTTPIGGARVPSGTVRLRLVDRDGQTHHRAVQVSPDEEARAFFELN